MFIIIDNYYSLALPEVAERGTFKSHSNPAGGSPESCMHIRAGALFSFAINVLIVKFKEAPAKVYYDNKDTLQQVIPAIKLTFIIIYCNCC